jgi:hypothetical protein
MFKKGGGWLFVTCYVLFVVRWMLGQGRWIVPSGPNPAPNQGFQIGNPENADLDSGFREWT